MADWIPVVSQVKSVIQMVCNDREGAKETQMNFFRQCPGISQVTSAGQLFQGDTESAKQTQLEFMKTVGGVVNSVPLVGHVKGLVHYACGDMEGGHAAMKVSTHTTAVVGGGIGGFIVGGPAGSVALGIAAGTATDGMITAIEFGATGNYNPMGILSPLSDPKNPGKWVDGIAGVAADGLVGAAAGYAASTIQEKIETQTTANQADAAKGCPPEAPVTENTAPQQASRTTPGDLFDPGIMTCSAGAGGAILTVCTQVPKPTNGHSDCE